MKKLSEITNYKLQITNYKLPLISKIICIVFFFSAFGNKAFGIVYITSSTTINSANLSSFVGISDGIEVSNGAKLTIDGVTINFGLGKKILLTAPSGGNANKLYLLNGTILKTASVGVTWQGIVAIGNSSIDQYGPSSSDYPDGKPNNTSEWEGSIDPAQTLVDCSGGEIKFATIGINSKDGAVIRARDIDFIDCETGVKIEAYLADPTSSDPYYYFNACFLMDCDFNWNNILIFQ